MKRVFTVLLTLMFMLSMVATPVMAKGGGGSKAGGKSSISSSVKGNQSTVASSETTSEKGKKSNATNDTYRQKLQTNKALKNTNINSIGDYPDTTGHWASKAVKTMKSLGIINGYQDGTFQPDSPLTNSEAVVMMVKMAKLLGTDAQTEEVAEDEVVDEETTDEETTDEETTDEETDETETEEVPTWAQDSVKEAKALKIINVNRFHSQVQASRAQSAVMLAKALNLQPVNNGELPFSDVGFLTGEDLGYLVALQQAGIIQGSPDGKFNPNSSITRGEIAAMLTQVVEPPADEITTDETATDETTTDATTTGGTNTDGTTTDGTTT